jgi:hypothetical protein
MGIGCLESARLIWYKLELEPDTSLNLVLKFGLLWKDY